MKSILPKMNLKVFPFDEFPLSLWEWHAWESSKDNLPAFLTNPKKLKENCLFLLLSWVFPPTPSKLSLHARKLLCKRQECNLLNRDFSLSFSLPRPHPHQFARECSVDGWNIIIEIVLVPFFLAICGRACSKTFYYVLLFGVAAIVPFQRH